MRSNNSWLLSAAIAVACGAAIGLAQFAHADAAPDSAERCITLRSIKQTRVLDDQNILFYTNNNKNYKNHLPYPCGGLASANSFLYRTSESKLCNVDIISVLDRVGGGFTPGAACGLGMFEALDQQQLDELTKKPAKNH
jgi:hypothetical protein